MPTITKVRFAHPDGALADTFRALPDVDVSVLREAGTDPEHDVYFFRFEGGDLDEIEAALEADHTVAEAESMPRYEDERMFGVVFTAGTKLLASKVTEEQGFVLEARRASPESGTYGWVERWLLPDRRALQSVWEFARGEGFDFDILELRRFDRRTEGQSAGITDEQREALLAAHAQGYFDEPREASLEQLAESLGLSSTAVSGRLRRGVKTLIESTLIEEPD